MSMQVHRSLTNRKVNYFFMRKLEILPFFSNLYRKNTYKILKLAKTGCGAHLTVLGGAQSAKTPSRAARSAKYQAVFRRETANHRKNDAKRHFGDG